MEWAAFARSVEESRNEIYIGRTYGNIAKPRNEKRKRKEKILNRKKKKRRTGVVVVVVVGSHRRQDARRHGKKERNAPSGTAIVLGTYIRFRHCDGVPCGPNKATSHTSSSSSPIVKTFPSCCDPAVFPLFCFGQLLRPPID